jgi:hypothetical protein
MPAAEIQGRHLGPSLDCPSSAMTYRILELFIEILLCISFVPPSILVRAQTVSRQSAFPGTTDILLRQRYAYYLPPPLD